jgi:hypothetical protein
MRRAKPGLSSREISVDPRTPRRSFLRLALGTPIAGAALAASGSSGPTQTGAGGGSGGGGGGGAGSASYWFLTGQPQQAVRENTVKRFNTANPNGKIGYTEFANGAYTTKSKTALGASQGPSIKVAGGRFPSGVDRDFLKFVYDTASKAKVFAQSWDQALPPTAAETLLDNIAKLFQLSITPQQWVDNMNKAIVK